MEQFLAVMAKVWDMFFLSINLYGYRFTFFDLLVFSAVGTLIALLIRGVIFDS